MEKQYKNAIIGIVIFLVIIIGMKIITGTMQPKLNLDEFTICLKDSGATFYGAFWCHNCQDQKKMFGSSKKYLPYVECSTANGKEQNALCKEKGIKGYPTWEFADGTRPFVGVVQLEQLAEKTSCVLPTVEK
jgi:hypothetical protein